MKAAVSVPLQLLIGRIENGWSTWALTSSTKKLRCDALLNHLMPEHPTLDRDMQFIEWSAGRIFQPIESILCGKIRVRCDQCLRLVNGVFYLGMEMTLEVRQQLSESCPQMFGSLLRHLLGNVCRRSLQPTEDPLAKCNNGRASFKFDLVSSWIAAECR